MIGSPVRWWAAATARRTVSDVGCDAVLVGCAFQERRLDRRALNANLSIANEAVGERCLAAVAKVARQGLVHVRAGRQHEVHTCAFGGAGGERSVPAEVHTCWVAPGGDAVRLDRVQRADGSVELGRRIVVEVWPLVADERRDGLEVLVDQCPPELLHRERSGGRLDVSAWHRCVSCLSQGLPSDHVGGAAHEAGATPELDGRAGPEKRVVTGGGILVPASAPPTCQTVARIRRCSSALYARCASSRTSIVRWRRSLRRHHNTYRVCASIMKTWELCPSPELGPVIMKRFGKPATTVPKCASMPPDHASASVRSPRPVIGMRPSAFWASKPVPKMIVSAWCSLPSVHTMLLGRPR